MRGAHGTLSAVLAVGGGFGVAPAARLLPIRYTGDRLRDWQASLVWAAERADIVLCPWGLDPLGGVARELAMTLERHCLGRALFVCPVGNRPHVIAFPACLAGTLGVGAHTSEGEPAAYSGRGDGLDVLAPSSGGTRPLPAIPVFRGRGSARRPSGSRLLGGTSAAAALAAGVAARVLAARPELSPPQLLDLLRGAVRHGTIRAWSAAAGFGLPGAAGERLSRLTLDPESTHDPSRSTRRPDSLPHRRRRE